MNKERDGVLLAQKIATHVRGHTPDRVRCHWFIPDPLHPTTGQGAHGLPVVLDTLYPTEDAAVQHIKDIIENKVQPSEAPPCRRVIEERKNADLIQYSAPQHLKDGQQYLLVHFPKPHGPKEEHEHFVHAVTDGYPAGF